MCRSLVDVVNKGATPRDVEDLVTSLERGGSLVTLALWATTEPDFRAARLAIPNLGFESIDDEPTREALIGWYDAGAAQESLEALAADIAAAIDEVERMWQGKSDARDYNLYEFGPVRALLAGGKSFGDEPSDRGYDAIRLSQLFGLDEVAGFYR
jgi:hypothetical protein